MKKQRVFAHAKSVYVLEDSFFDEYPVRALVVDLDNTLDSAYEKTPRKEAFELKKRLEEKNISLIVISNNKKKRVKPYCEKLGVPYLASAKKHRKGKILKFLKGLGYDVSELLFVGDQIFTDRIYVKKLHGRLILTEPLVQKDQFFTRFVRRLDSKVRASWKEKGLLGIAIGKENE